MDIVSFENLLDEFAYRKFCFIIGAGASISSGIQSGTQIAAEWFNILVQTIRKDHKNEIFTIISEYAYNYEYMHHSKEEIAEKLGPSNLLKCLNAYTNSPDKLSWELIAYIIFSGVGESYFLIAKFLSERKPGYIQNYVRDKLQGKIASSGYHWLARIIETTESNIVITTNFDDLLLQAIHKQFDTSYKSPVVISHSDIAHQIAYVDFSKQPTIFKIHHDFLLSPKNTVAEVMNYSDDVIQALNRIFENFTPIVIGYAGANDGLMDYLKRQNTPMDIFWTHLKGHPPSGAAFQKVDDKHKVHSIEILGFDSFVATLAQQVFELTLPKIDLLTNDFSLPTSPVDVEEDSPSKKKETDKIIMKSAYDEFQFNF